MAANKNAQKQSAMQLQALSIDQLKGLKESMDQDIQALQRAYESLRGARTRFGDSKSYLDGFKGYDKGQELLVPVSSSLYVPGTLHETDKVLVDVGTGYYIQQSIPRAQDFFGKRMNQMKESMDNVAEAMTLKQRQQNTVIDLIKAKSQAQMQAQQQQQ